MGRKEFLDELKQALQENNLDKTLIDNNIEYYDRYIIDRINNGASEIDVIAELGSGRVIAKTIVDANKKGAKSINYSSGSDNTDTNNSGESKGKTGFGKILEKVKEFFKNIFDSKDKEDKKSGIFKMYFNGLTFKDKIKLLFGISCLVTFIVITIIMIFNIVAAILPFVIIMGICYIVAKKVLR